MALRVGAVQDPSVKAAIVSKLVTDIVTTQQNHVTVGIIGAKALLPALTDAGKLDVAVTLAAQTT